MIRRAVVLEVLESGLVWVRIPSLTEDAPVGPLPCAVLPRALQVGDEVAVAHMDGQRTELLVLAVL